MRTPRPRPGGRLRLPRRTARLRLTVLYGGAVFLACGATVLAVTYLLVRPARERVAAHVSMPAPLQAQAKLIPIAAVQPAEVAIRMAGLGQLAFDRQQLLIASGIALAVIAVAAAAIGWLIAGRVLRPLRTITAAARRISASSLHERLALPGPDDELKELADTLDGLFARLEASFDAQRRFAANASHELRTPLTRERTLLQVTLADPAATTGTWQAVSQATARLQRRAGTPHRSAAHPGQQRSRSRRTRARRPGRHHQRSPGRRPPRDQPPGPARPRRHPARRPRRRPPLVQQLAANLIDNAVRHNIPGGDIQVTTSTSHAGAVLSVTSSGQVIPAADVDRLFQPFQRLGPRPARRDGGHGLGLSIVRAIATAHAATITAQPRPGGGLAIDVTFPLSTSSPPRRTPRDRAITAS